MKRFLTIFMAGLCLFVLGSVFPPYKAIAGDKEIQNVTLQKNEIVEHDYFAAGNTVNISGTINGDAYLAGGNVTMDGVINGDLITAGGNVTILGKVNGNVRAAGGNVIFASTVEKNATIIGGSISMSEMGNINGSLVSAGGNISVNSPVGKDIHSAGGQLSLGSSIGSNVYAYVNQINLTSSSRIDGDLNYWSEQKTALNNAATVSGKINYHFAQSGLNKDKSDFRPEEAKKILGLITAGVLMLKVYVFIITLLFGYLLIKLLPVYTSEIVQILEKSPFIAFGSGLLTIAVLPVLVIALIISIVGIPIIFALGIVLILAALFGQIVISILIGKKALQLYGRKNISWGISLVVGLVVYTVVSLIPFINVILGVITYLAGLGVLIIQKRNLYLLLRQKSMI